MVIEKVLADFGVGNESLIEEYLAWLNRKKKNRIHWLGRRKEGLIYPF